MKAKWILSLLMLGIIFTMTACQKGDVTENFKVGDIDKYTVVIWVDGPDKECDNSLIGGEIKMHMTLTEEHILQDEEIPQDEI